MVTKRIAEAPSASAADASATNVEEFVEDDEGSESCEGAECSDDENDLHGPCNVRPSDADDDPR